MSRLRLILYGIGLGAIAVLSILLWRADARADKCEWSRYEDEQRYFKAQRDAERLNAEYVAQVEERQRKVSHAHEISYRADLARLRLEYSRLRSKTAPGDAGSSKLSSLPNPAARTDETPVPFPSSDILRAAETELQLNALISWIEAQHE